MATAHTPGPWTAKGPYVFAGKDCIGVCDTDNAPADRMDANARLMAAAPDLLDALRELHSAADAYRRAAHGGVMSNETINRMSATVLSARAVLSRVEG